MKLKRELGAILVSCALAVPALAGHREDVGYYRLTAEFDTNLTDGAGIRLSQVETSEPGGYFIPNAADAEIPGKNILLVSPGPTNPSSHATMVACNYSGMTVSLTPGVSNISAYLTDDWMAGGFLNTGNGLLEPLTETNDVQNHSWVGGAGNASETLRRFDYAIERDGFTAVVAVNNGTGTNLPEFMCQAYNSIAVGKSDGDHSAGFTSVDAPGRIKPDIVAPRPTTSEATPIVASAAALLLATVAADPALTNAGAPECIKALLLAGATKDEFPSWSRTPARPLDMVRGAGELNLYDSHRILLAGRQIASPTSLVGRTGWNHGTVQGGSNNTYFFRIPESNILRRLSAVVAWNRRITDGPPPMSFDPTPFMPNLDLELATASNFAIGTVLDLSTSALDNVEHVWQTGLPAGDYVLRVSSATTATYAIAWLTRAGPAAEIISIGLSSNGYPIMAAQAQTGSVYGLEATTNLDVYGPWTLLDTWSAQTNLFIFEETNAPSLPRRFYRAVPDP